MTPLFSIVSRVGQEAANVYILTFLVHLRQPVIYGKVRSLLSVAIEQGTTYRDKGIHVRFGPSLKSSLQIRVRTSYLQESKRYLQRMRRKLVLLFYWSIAQGPWVAPENSNT